MRSIPVDLTATGRDSAHQRRKQRVKGGQGHRQQSGGQRQDRRGTSRQLRVMGRAVTRGGGSIVSSVAELKGDKVTHDPWIQGPSGHR